MKRQLLWFVAAVLVTMVALPMALAGGADDKLAKGEVIVSEKEVSGYDMPRVTAVGVINAPMEKVWKIIDDCSNYTKTMTRVEESKELSRNGSKIRCKVVLDLPWPLGTLEAVTDAVHTVQPGKLYKREWKLVSGDYHYNVGSWTLEPFNGDPKRTKATYRVLVKPKISIPDGIKARAQKSALPDLFENLRKQSGAK